MSKILGSEFSGPGTSGNPGRFLGWSKHMTPPRGILRLAAVVVAIAGGLTSGHAQSLELPNAEGRSDTVSPPRGTPEECDKEGTRTSRQEMGAEFICPDDASILPPPGDTLPPASSWNKGLFPGEPIAPSPPTDRRGGGLFPGEPTPPRPPAPQSGGTFPSPPPRGGGLAPDGPGS